MSSSGCGPRRLLSRLWLLGLGVLVAAMASHPLSGQAPRSVSTTVTATPQGATASTTVTAVGAAYHPSRVLVRFRRGTQDFLPGSGAARAFAVLPDLFLVPNPPGLAVADVVRRYKANPNVLYAEPDFVVQALETTPTDPLWTQQWDMAKIAAPKAWDTQTNASDVVVAVIDTGIDFTHPDLAENVDSSHSFTCINGPCVAGGQDDFGHGTHVAGTIGAAANNGIGIAGITWAVKMISLKFLDSGGSGNISDAVSAFDQIASLKSGGLNIRVTSNSWGGGGYTQALKDAMTAVESRGIVNVCAAGNSGLNADASPMYPAAYENRGIVSVLATDANDLGASFTNYGLASVDLAAPGVSTLSTVPKGSCSLCDPSGYKLLSGTSMATPHVSGVMAALMHLNPGLSAAEARDLVLDPGSYDPMTDARARSSSTGGRLNFSKAIANPRLFSPEPLNSFPTLTIGPNIFTSAGSPVSLSATASDPDPADSLRVLWSKSSSAGSTWLFGWMLDSLFPSPSGSSFSFTAPSTARAASVPYEASVADNRGGGASAEQVVTVSPSPSPGAPPVGSLSLSATSVRVGGSVTVNFPVTDPDGTGTGWDLWAAGAYGASGWCCFTGSSTSITFNSPGVYRIGVQAIDHQLDLSTTRPTAVVSVGGGTGTPPVAKATLDKLSGTVPFSVNIDMSASTGAIAYYFMGCGGGGFTTGSNSATGSCSYTTPGTYWLLLQVQDNTGLMDLVSAYVVAMPPNGSPDTTPPEVSITAPASGANVSSPTTVSADASDTGSSVAKVEFRLDNSVSGTLLGTATAWPYNITWNPAGTSPGPHTIYAIATDGAGNVGTSSGVTITVSVPAPPTVTISVLTTTPKRKSSLPILATADATLPATVAKVEFYVNGARVSTDTSSPYSYTWKVPNAPGRTYSLTAKAYDSQGQVGTSNTITVTPQ